MFILIVNYNGGLCNKVIGCIYILTDSCLDKVADFAPGVLFLLIVNYNGGLCNKVIGDVYVLTVVDLLLFSQYWALFLSTVNYNDGLCNKVIGCGV